mmetsp:Transcript_16141/g.34151  ORF Transcript_16141/g.34151 Transcript_16141/m.34151 type:complete len:146 (+) Transcript_16141:1686-2123(+)
MRTLCFKNRRHMQHQGCGQQIIIQTPGYYRITDTAHIKNLGPEHRREHVASLARYLALTLAKILVTVQEQRTDVPQKAQQRAAVAMSVLRGCQLLCPSLTESISKNRLKVYEGASFRVRDEVGNLMLARDKAIISRAPKGMFTQP